MGKEPRDGWDVFDLVTKAIAAILVPVILLVVGNNFTAQQGQANRAEQVSDRLTVLISHLSSTNANERLLAARFMEYLADAGQFPEELLPIMWAVVNDPNSEVSHTGAHILERVVATNPELKQAVIRTARPNTPTAATLRRAQALNPELQHVLGRE